MTNETVKIHRSAKFEKLTPLEVDFSYCGKLRVRRWRKNWMMPNAIAMEDLTAGGTVIVKGNYPGIYEVRNAA